MTAVSGGGGITAERESRGNLFDVGMCERNKGKEIKKMILTDARSTGLLH